MYTTKGFYKNGVLKFIEPAPNIEKSYDYYLITIRTQRVDVPDPFDRLIIGTAISKNLPMISVNEKNKLFGSIINLIEAQNKNP
jgi:hypothetical protein